jgi:hypothetical protein
MCLQAQENGKVKDSIYKANLGRSRPVKAIIKTSPFAIFYWQIPLTGEYRVLGEFMMGKKQSVTLGGSYLTRSLMFVMGQNMSSNSGNSKVSANGYRVQGSWRYYIFNKMYRPEGLFISAHASFASVKFNFKDYPDDFQRLEHFNLNLLIGGQLIIANRVSLEVFFGPGYKNNTYSSHCRPGYELFDFEDMPQSLSKHFKFSLGMNVGVAL